MAENMSEKSGLLELVSDGKLDWYTDEIMFPYQLARIIGTTFDYEKDPTIEKRVVMENATKEYNRYEKDLRYKMGVDDKK